MIFKEIHHQGRLHTHEIFILFKNRLTDDVIVFFLFECYMTSSSSIVKMMKWQLMEEEAEGEAYKHQQYPGNALK